MDTTENKADEYISSQFTVIYMDATNDGFLKTLTLEFIDTHNYSSMMVAREIFKAIQSGKPYVTLSVKVQTCEEPQK